MYKWDGSNQATSNHINWLIKILLLLSSGWLADFGNEPIRFQLKCLWKINQMSYLNLRSMINWTYSVQCQQQHWFIGSHKTNCYLARLIFKIWFWLIWEIWFTSVLMCPLSLSLSNILFLSTLMYRSSEHSSRCLFHISSLWQPVFSMLILITWWC